MSNMPKPILSLRNVGKTYDSNGQKVEALRGANLEVMRGDFICLIGASGCGKSTLLRIVAGFEEATTGQALMWGMPIASPDPTRGMVFQDYGLFPWLSVRDNIGFGPAARGRSKREVRETAEHFLNLVGLGKFGDVYPHQLSGGMKQRVAIARVLANEAEVVLMDEPFGALDAMTRERLQYELLELWEKTKLTVLFVTHAIEEAIFLANRVVVMSPGPGHIDSDIINNLARPRDVVSSDFNEMRRALSGKLHSHHSKQVA